MTMTMTSIFIDQMKAEPDTLTPQHNTNMAYHGKHQNQPFIVHAIYKVPVRGVLSAMNVGVAAREDTILRK